MGKGAGKRRAQARRQHAEKEDDVGIRSQEDRRCSAGAVGEGEGCSEEDCLVQTLHRGSPRELKPLGVKPRALLVGKPEPDVSARDRWRVSLVAEAKCERCAEPLL